MSTEKDSMLRVRLTQRIGCYHWWVTSTNAGSC